MHLPGAGEVGFSINVMFLQRRAKKNTEGLVPSFPQTYEKPVLVVGSLGLCHVFEIIYRNSGSRKANHTGITKRRGDLGEGNSYLWRAIGTSQATSKWNWPRVSVLN